MKQVNSISIPVILYGILFIIAVHSIGLIIDRLLQVLFVNILSFDYLPFIRLAVLFFEILFIAKFLKNNFEKTITIKALIDVMVMAIIGVFVWGIILYLNLKPTVMLCGNTLFEEDWYERVYGVHNNNIKIVQIIETIVISLSIFVYTIFRIREMPKETKKISE